MSKRISIRPKIGARASRLAQIQAKQAALAIGVEADFIGLSTKGDQITDKHLRDLGGKELFVHDIEKALLNRQIDLAVHSLKDMPATRPSSIVMAAILPRGDYRDALVSPKLFKDLSLLPLGTRIGTASPRRHAQIKAHRPDLEPILLRGNVDSRLKKIQNGEIDCALLAMAGLERLKRTEMAVAVEAEKILPAAAQGAICVECREDDDEMRLLCERAHHEATARAVYAERGFTNSFGASCHIPVAALALHQGDEIWLRALLLMPDGSAFFEHEQRGTNPIELGKEAARHIARQVGEARLRAIGVELNL